MCIAVICVPLVDFIFMFCCNTVPLAAIYSKALLTNESDLTKGYLRHSQTLNTSDVRTVLAFVTYIKYAVKKDMSELCVTPHPQFFQHEEKPQLKY